MLHCSVVTKRVWCLQSTNAVTWMLRECGYTRATNVALTLTDQILLLIEEEAPFSGT
jgi:hypothetical protein